jgi:metal-sulfur cluster biosynthetic enzyme
MQNLITTEDIWRVLATIPDPEFGLSIVDLGLIYDVTTDGRDVAVAMTLTSPSCPAGGMIHDGVQAALAALPGAAAVRVELVWEPAWTPECLTEAAREHLGWNPE